MSGLNKNRYRNQAICFRTTSEERRQIEAKIKVSGLPKGEYCRKSLLQQQITITAGKYQSDRLSLEIRRLRDRIDQLDRAPMRENDALKDCKVLLEQLTALISQNTK